MKSLNSVSLLIIAMVVFGQNLYAQSIDKYAFEFDGKHYELVKSKKSYVDACKYAVSHNGYLAHIDNDLEQQAIFKAIVEGAKIKPDYTTCPDGGNIAYIWIGATDAVEEGVWMWDGNNDGQGAAFWKGQGELGANDGAIINGSYNNWGGRNRDHFNEPDNYENQDAAAIALDGWPSGSARFGEAGEWNDVNTDNVFYFIVEYDK